MLRLLVRNLETTAEAQSDKASGPSGGLMAANQMLQLGGEL